MHYKNGISHSHSSFSSPAFRINKHKLYPIRPGYPLSLNLGHHPWHIIGPNESFIAAFSNYDCAIMTANHIIESTLDHLSQTEKIVHTSMMRIVDRKSDLQFAVLGKEWVPVA